ncbi:Rad52 22 double-strand break repair protein [Mycena olivaceomarginata]|nr:Rad52 22 double-strand break repair protein [Mycena olivaceomarginata]
MSETTYDRVSRLQAKLNRKLEPGGGPKLTSNIVSLTTDYMDYEETRRYNAGVSAVMRVSLKEGVFHEGVGYGMIEKAKARECPWIKCRTLRTFVNGLGNCLYDKQYTAEIVKIKVPPVRT